MRASKFKKSTIGQIVTVVIIAFSLLGDIDLLLSLFSQNSRFAPVIDFIGSNASWFQFALAIFCLFLYLKLEGDKYNERFALKEELQKNYTNNQDLFDKFADKAALIEFSEIRQEYNAFRETISDLVQREISANRQDFKILSKYSIVKNDLEKCKKLTDNLKTPPKTDWDEWNQKYANFKIEYGKIAADLRSATYLIKGDELGWDYLTNGQYSLHQHDHYESGGHKFADFMQDYTEFNYCREALIEFISKYCPEDLVGQAPRMTR